MKTSVVVLLIFLSCASQVAIENSGPFKTTLVRSEKCKTPLTPYAKNPAYLYYCDAHNSKGRVYMRANFTVLSVNPTVKSIVKTYIKEGDIWKIMYKTTSVGCHGIVMEAMKYLFKIKNLDSRSCVPKGTYTYNDLDFNYIQHKWLNSFMYGKFLWIMHTLTNAGTNVCWEYETEISPIPE